jgi:hypothetical protein
MDAMVGKYAANKMLRGQMAKYQSKKPCGDQVSESHTVLQCSLLSCERPN